MVIVLAGLYCAWAINRNFIWRDTHALWTDAQKKSPGKGRPCVEAGLAYYREGRLNEAMEEYRAALILNPNNAPAHNNLGNIYYSKDLYDQAMKEYLAAIMLDPSVPAFHHNAGNIYYYTGDIDRAIYEYTTALRLAPRRADTHYTLGLAYLKKGLKEKAREEFLRSDFPEAKAELRALSQTR